MCPWFEPVLAVPSRVIARFRRSWLSPFFFVRERNMFSIGHWEVLLIVLVIFILFGHRLPSVMRSLGRGVVEFKQGMSGVADDDTDKVEKRDA
jgi:sec-independent protein translocase protein TatA